MIGLPMSVALSPATSKLENPGAGQDSPSLPYVYLCSAPHSGSTLLACLLNAHSQIASVGEFGAPFNPQRLKCACGVMTGECPFWNHWATLARQAGIEFEIGNPQISLGWEPNRTVLTRLYYHQFVWQPMNRLRDSLFPSWTRCEQHASRAIDKSIRLARLLCRIVDKPVFFDSTKNTLQLRFLARRRNIRLKLISLVRDGRGVVNSVIRHYKTPPAKAVQNWIEWMQQQQAATRWLPPADVLHVRLEELWHTPDEQFSRILNFCGVDPIPLSALSFEPTDSHIVGNLMRYTFKGDIKPDYRWKTELDPAALALFERRAGRLNRLLGAAD